VFVLSTVTRFEFLLISVVVGEKAAIMVAKSSQLLRQVFVCGLVSRIMTSLVGGDQIGRRKLRGIQQIPLFLVGIFLLFAEAG